MKRIFLGLTILLWVFLSNFPFDELIGRSDRYSSVLHLIIIPLISVVAVALFVRVSGIRERLSEPVSGLGFLTAGIVLYTILALIFLTAGIAAVKGIVKINGLFVIALVFTVSLIALLIKLQGRLIELLENHGVFIVGFMIVAAQLVLFTLSSWTIDKPDEGPMLIAMLFLAVFLKFAVYFKALSLVATLLLLCGVYRLFVDLIPKEDFEWQCDENDAQGH